MWGRAWRTLRAHLSRGARPSSPPAAAPSRRCSWRSCETQMNGRHRGRSLPNEPERMRVGFESMRVGFESRSRRAVTCDMPTRAVAPREAPQRSHVVPHTLVTFTLSLSYSARVPLRRAGADARHARSGPRAIDKLLSLSSCATRSVSWLAMPASWLATPAARRELRI